MTDQPSDAPPEQPSSGPSGLFRERELGAYLARAWELVTQDLVLFVVGYLVLALILSASAITVVGPIILAGPLAFGYLRVIQKRLQGSTASVGDIFEGFQDFAKSLVTVLLLALIGLVGTAVSAVLVSLPCIGQMAGLGLYVVLSALLYFVVPIAALSDAGPGDAVSQSVRFCVDNFWPMLLLGLVTLVVGAAGVLACGVGALVTGPIALATNVIAYHEYYLRKTRQRP